MITPRIEAVSVIGLMHLRIFWCDQNAPEEVDLSQWIATGGDILAPLRDAQVFAKAAVSNFGTAISWDDGSGDLSIDAIHLRRLINQQPAKIN